MRERLGFVADLKRRLLLRRALFAARPEQHLVLRGLVVHGEPFAVHLQDGQHAVNVGDGNEHVFVNRACFALDVGESGQVASQAENAARPIVRRTLLKADHAGLNLEPASCR